MRRTEPRSCTGERLAGLGALTIVSGGQTGVDRGALDGALAAGLPVGGWCPAGRRAEDGVIPDCYPLAELSQRDYLARTRRNVVDSDATLLLTFGVPSGGTAQTLAFCRRFGKPYLVIDGDATSAAEAAARLAEFVASVPIVRLNVAGPRASRVPAAHAYARQVIERFGREWA